MQYFSNPVPSLAPQKDLFFEFSDFVRHYLTNGLTSKKNFTCFRYIVETYNLKVFMRISPISSSNTNFGGIASKIEKAAATLETTSNTKRKSIPIEYHNALVKLTAWKVFTLAAALFGIGGYTVSDQISDKDAKDLANAIEIADIDTTAHVQIKGITQDGNPELILQKKDGNPIIIDLKNTSIYTENSVLKKVE